MLEKEYIILIIGMGLVTYLARLIPLLVLSRRNLPKWLSEGLDIIPVAILSAILLPLLVTSGEPKRIEFFQPELLVAIPTFIFALKTRSLSLTIVLGMLLFWIASKLM